MAGTESPLREGGLVNLSRVQVEGMEVLCRPDAIQKEEG